MITQYRVWSLDGRHECVATTTSCTVKGLLDGVTYRFVVYAFNKIGRSPASAPSNAVSSTSRHGSVIHTFTNANPQWNVLTDMGTMSEPSNAPRDRSTSRSFGAVALARWLVVLTLGSSSTMEVVWTSLARTSGRAVARRKG